MKDSEKALGGRIKAALVMYGEPKSAFMRAAAAFFSVSCAEALLSLRKNVNPVGGWKEFLLSESAPAKIFWIAAVFLWLSALYRIFPKRLFWLDGAALAASSLAFSLVIVFKSDSFYLGAAAGAVAAVFCAHALRNGRFSEIKLLKKIPPWTVVLAISAATAVFIAATTVANHLCFGTSCFDMGIFVQTFHSLSKTLTAVVTCERDKFMSHFQVHGSFIFYLLTPIYAIFPKGETLLVIQAVFTAAGVAPLYLIAKNRGFRGAPLVLICSLYVFSLGIVLPCYFQFHENALLPPILMWLLYAAECDNIPLLYIMSVLTCSVKEDAALYVICLGIYALIDKKGLKRLHGLILALGAAVYFAIIMHWLTVNGDGKYMTASRFGILMANGGGFSEIAKNVFNDPGYFISLILSEKTLLFFAQTMFPLAFLPFFTSKIHRWLLAVPYIIMNLVVGAGYAYAANIGFQYIPGPMCMLLYLSVINASEMSEKFRWEILTAASVISLVTVFALASPKLTNIKNYRENRDYYRSAKECIESVPEDASVLANAFFLPHAANRREIYELDDGCFTPCEGGETIERLDGIDYCIFSAHDPLTERARPILEAQGFELCRESAGGFVKVYRRE